MENVEDRNHFRNSLTGMAIATEAWPVLQSVASRKRSKRLKRQPAREAKVTEEDLKDILKEASKSQRQEQSFAKQCQQGNKKDGEVQRLLPATANQIDAWLDAIKVEHNEEGRLLLNDEQFTIAKIVA